MTMNNTHDEFSGIFDDLDPQQFLFTGTSILDVECETGPFLQFVYTQRLSAQMQYACAAGEPDFVFILATDHRICGFVPQPPEEMGQYLDRMASEAKQMGATRLFFARKTQISARPIPRGQHCDAMDTLADERPDVGLHEGIIWYAEERVDGEIVRLSGTFELGGPARLVDTNYYSDQQIAALDSILSHGE